MQWLLNEILEHSPDSFGVFDKHDQLIFCNQHMADVWGLTKQQAIGMNIEALVKHAYLNADTINIETDDIDTWLNDARSRKRKAKYRVFEADWKNGTWVQVSELMIDKELLVTTSRDITELKQTQLKLTDALEKITQIAAIDELTQVSNRRSFNEHAEAEIKKSKRYAHPLSLLLLDIDHFKQVNDNYGHANGDLVLQQFAALFRDNLRDSDMFARIGGEEFVALLTETQLDDAQRLAERPTCWRNSRLHCSIMAEPLT
jgi:PAS domain S-box-containing protein